MRTVEESLLFVEFIYCACNCGKTLAKYDSKGRERRYIVGHNNSGRKLGVRILNRFCMIDPTHKPYIKKHGWEDWRKYKDGYICKRCHDRLINGPIYDSRRLWFKDKRVKLKYTPKTGYCSLCSNNIFDKSCRRTSMHHLFYITIMPWFGTVEVCNSCHRKEHYKIKKW